MERRWAVAVLSDQWLVTEEEDGGADFSTAGREGGIWGRVCEVALLFTLGLLPCEFC